MAASDATDHNGASVTVAHRSMEVFQSVSQQVFSARLCIEVLHVECYLCINATCAIVRGIKYDLCISALLYRVFLYKYCYTEYLYFMWR